MFDTGTIKIKLRAILRLLAAAGVAPAADIASIPTAPDTEAAGKITGWFSIFVEKLTPLASGGADGAISDGLDELIGEARARRAPGESLNERHVVLALQAMLASRPGVANRVGAERALAGRTVLDVTPRVLDLSGARSDGSRQASPPQGMLRSQVSFGDTAGAAAQPRDASSILATHSYAIGFFNAANSDEDFDMFIRNASMFTLDAQMRQVLLADAQSSRTALAAALEAKLAQTTCDACSLSAILGKARTSSQLLDTFRSL